MTSKKYIIIVTVFVVAISVAAFGVVSAQTALSDDQTKRISDSCLLTKNTLTQLHSSDALLRVNRGQIYESMYTKLMSRFNSRLLNNKLDGSELVVASKEYRATLDAFRADYIAYEEQLSKAIKVDCLKQPDKFYDAVVQARIKRETVHSDVIQLNQQIDDYRVALGKFEAEFKTTVGENK